jgi:hypothetical protein
VEIQNNPDDRYLVENDALIGFYRANDRKYQAIREGLLPPDLPLRDRRRLRLIDGVGQLFDNYIHRCQFDHVYYLAVTRDDANHSIFTTTCCLAAATCKERKLLMP